MNREMRAGDTGAQVRASIRSWLLLRFIMAFVCLGMHLPLIAHAAGEAGPKLEQGETAPNATTLRKRAPAPGVLESDPDIDLATDATSSRTVKSHGEHPWEVGITAEQRQAARQLLAEGNVLWNAARFSEAAMKFAQALAHWDHPRIHYNLALALIALNRPLEVHEHLVASMRYGLDALAAGQRGSARLHLRELEQERLSVIDVKCETPGAKVRIDGRLAFTAPGRYRGWVLPGPHTITASKPRHISSEHSVNLRPGVAWVTEVRTHTEAELTRYRRRWPSLVHEHLMLAGAGAALLALGTVFTLSANAAIEDINERCKDIIRCEMSGELSGLDSRATELRALAGFTYVAGGSAFVTGLVLTLLNLEKPYLIHPPKDRPSFVPLSPLAGGHTLGLVGSGRF